MTTIVVLQNRGRCRWHRHSLIWHLIAVPEHSGTGLVPVSEFLLIAVPDWTDAGQSDIPSFIKINKDGQGYNPHVHTGIVM
jgi:hypothetical protein